MKATVTSNNFRQVTTRLDDGIAKAVRTTALETTAEITTRIQQRELIDTGNYFRSWLFDVASDGKSAEVATGVPYSRYLEFGTRFMPARPHIVPAAKWIARQVSSYFPNIE